MIFRLERTGTAGLRFPKREGFKMEQRGMGGLDIFDRAAWRLLQRFASAKGAAIDEINKKKLKRKAAKRMLRGTFFVTTRLNSVVIKLQLRLCKLFVTNYRLKILNSIRRF